MGKNQHVVPDGNKWSVKGEGNSRDTSTHDTQAAAIDAARSIAINQQAEVVIHRPDGRIQRHREVCRGSRYAGDGPG